MKYNITTREGDQESVTVFIGAESLVATKDHPNFKQITEYLTAGNDDADRLRGMFDVSVSLAGHFKYLSERVAAHHGYIYLDGDRLHNALTETIVRFMADGQQDVMPLVNFMEKVEQNPNQHSKENLFRWLEKHDFAIDVDGDFYAYKAVRGDGLSEHGGTAMVNGKVINGRIPNQKGTVVEMPRSAVQHDPKVGCHTGLHAGNWRYAKTFISGGRIMLVKINPRDVVSVPTDSNDEKLRVCRYKVIEQVHAPVDTALYVGQEKDRLTARLKADAVEAGKKDEPAKPKRQRKAKGKAAPKPIEFPEYYEEFTTKHFRAMSSKDLYWLLGEWGVSPKPRNKEEQVKVVAKEARKRRKDLGL